MEGETAGGGEAAAAGIDCRCRKQLTPARRKLTTNYHPPRIPPSPHPDTMITDPAHHVTSPRPGSTRVQFVHSVECLPPSQAKQGFLMVLLANFHTENKHQWTSKGKLSSPYERSSFQSSSPNSCVTPELWEMLWKVTERHSSVLAWSWSDLGIMPSFQWKVSACNACLTSSKQCFQGKRQEMFAKFLFAKFPIPQNCIPSKWIKELQALLHLIPSFFTSFLDEVFFFGETHSAVLIFCTFERQKC